MGSLTVCAGANTQEVVDEYAEEVLNLGSDNFWYGDYLGNMYLIAITGNMWNPDIIPQK